MCEAFIVRSGVRQGCPLSALTFISIVEPLLKNIQDKAFRVFFIPGSGHQSAKTLAYMDDIAIIATSQPDLDRAALHLRIFCGMSGMSINWKKSQLCQLGREIPINVDGIQVVEEVKVLGVYSDAKCSGKLSYEKLVAKVTKKLNLWRLRDLYLGF